MPESTTQINSNNRINISTSMFTIWDDNGNQLRISCLDTGLSLAIWQPVFNQDGRRTYPQEFRSNTIVRESSAIALNQIICVDILNAYENKMNIKKGIFTNNSHTTMIEVEVKNDKFYLTIYRGCDATTHIPAFTSTFTFGSYNIISDYDPKTGEYNTETIQAEFFLFAKAISAYCDLCAGYIAGHGVQVTENQKNTKFMQYLISIMNAVHAEIPAQNTNYYRNNNTSSYSYGNGSNQSFAPQEIVKFNDLSDLME